MEPKKWVISHTLCVPTVPGPRFYVRRDLLTSSSVSRAAWKLGGCCFSCVCALRYICWGWSRSKQNGAEKSKEAGWPRAPRLRSSSITARRRVITTLGDRPCPPERDHSERMYVHRSRRLRRLMTLRGALRQPSSLKSVAPDVEGLQPSHRPCAEISSRLTTCDSQPQGGRDPRRLSHLRYHRACVPTLVKRR